MAPAAGKDESGLSAVKLAEHSVDETKRAEEIITDSLRSGEPSAGIPSGAGRRSIMLDAHFVSFSFRSQSSTDSYETVLEPRNTNARRSETYLDDQPIGKDYKPANTPHSSPSYKNDQPYSVRSSCDVSDVTDESMLMSPSLYPPLQVMDRSGVNEPARISSSLFTANSTPQKCSVASSESLFSLPEGHTSSNNVALVMGATSCKASELALSGESGSNQPSIAAGRVTARTDNNTRDSVVHKIHDQIDAKSRIPELSSDPRRNKGKIQPLPPSLNKKPDKPSSCRKKTWSCCCLCSCKSLSCCCSSSCSCCSIPKCSCCKMPSFSCCNCSLKWCCNWNCCPKKICCSSFNCCSNWSCSCPKVSCCPSCSNCSKAICCWNWSCWKLLCSSIWSCCSKGSCCKSWSCYSIGSCCKSWSCCSKGTCCVSWNCCSKGTCCRSWKCFSKGSCCKSCKSWSCCTTRSGCLTRN